jgi:DNA helicase-2/ATP-dependent DNA helicase PcrA
MLNNEQKLAVISDKKSALILAGAGAGKTKVLVSRLAHLINQGTPLNSLLAVTFTNKAANEMRERLEHQLGQSVSELWMGTFHAIAYKMLCVHCKERFKVISPSEQLSIIKRILSELELEIDAKLVLNYINTQKDAVLRANPEAFDTFGKLYALYQGYCNDEGLVDFGEILLRSYELLRDSSSIRNHYQDRFDYLLVDEFQDTNIIQYEWLRLLTEAKQNLFVVGDDDQSIYGWRGAKVENMTSFQSHYPLHDLIKLEQNYRCSKTILQAANAVIANNVKRLGKTLWTQSDDGERIDIYGASDEISEAQFVISKIKQWQASGGLLEEIAILYRCNAQSSTFEELLLEHHLPFQVSNGFKFYDRQEIKLTLSYLRVLSGRLDNFDFEFLASTPAKGIGKKSRELISHYALQSRVSYWQAAKEMVDAKVLPSRSHQALSVFLNGVEAMKKDSENLSLLDTLKLILKRAGFVEYYKKGVDASERIENLKVLLTIADKFICDKESSLSEREQFLAHTFLSSGDDTNPKGIQLMTLHASKGLEFGLVFLVGLEAGLFPAKTAPLEEERRLMYVGITRAKQKLVISYARQRTLFGNTINAKPSRFLSEIPRELIHVIKDSTTSLSANPYPKGTKISHHKFGEGVVVGNNEQLINVKFSEGNYWLVPEFIKDGFKVLT